MPRYNNALEVRFNVINDARWQILNRMPSVEEIIASGAVQDRDGWAFMVRSADRTLTPYYFDSSLQEIFPFTTGIAAPKGCYRQLVGNGVDLEFIVEHGLNSADVQGFVWERDGDRFYRVECEIFKIANSTTLLGFGFSEPPTKNQYEIEVFSFAGLTGGAAPAPITGSGSGMTTAQVQDIVRSILDSDATARADVVDLVAVAIASNKLVRDQIVELILTTLESSK